MLDISEKEITGRQAVVEGRISLQADVLKRIRKKKIPKGDVLETAKIAGILAAKNTPYTIPLCHPIPIDHILMNFEIKEHEIVIRSTVKGKARTGVEMEAFSAVAAAALTIYDMCKAFDRTAVITDIGLVKKTGGKTGDYERK